ncbi:response regulator transcription factor [Rhodoferax saidenbachensis]|uniref:DNA-binding NarL/FixJ family response regulator n=1 Tax=Rhodoferax saidenbachensis TaxID=1484693 RepID=A0ABU1ZP43_9BURK|nr:response regulator transcription factor [Rhodoferax saidenbachensis]MDR7306316.1 DNA-binding NarL/FixJ family response regulator [Rhodoferax saidenbachensis]
MSGAKAWVYATRDAGLRLHWQKALGHPKAFAAASFQELHALALPKGAQIWLDLALPDLPKWQDPTWQALWGNAGHRVIAASSNPKDDEAMAALDAGCAGYCHAFSDPGTLRQIQQVIQTGHVWIGSALMQRLIRGANLAAPLVSAPSSTWSSLLTHRETEVAVMAAKGASNLDIAGACRISERTVKAHLSAAFEKLGVSDRLQLALKVHGIQ